MFMTSVEFFSPFRAPVMHLTSVSAALETAHDTPSITMEMSSVYVENPYPLKVISSPPSTVPNLGVILVSNGVIDPS